MSATVRNILDSAQPGEMLRITAQGHLAIVLPAASGHGEFHMTHFTNDGRLLIGKAPLIVNQLAITFEKYGYPVDSPPESIDRQGNPGFKGFDANPYGMDEDERDALLGGANDATY